MNKFLILATTIFFINLLSIGTLSALSEKPYDDSSLKNQISNLSGNIDKQEKLIKEQTRAIEYLTNIIGEHQEVIIASQEKINQLEVNTVKEVLIKK